MVASNYPVTTQLSAGSILYVMKSGVANIVLLVQNNSSYKRTGDEAKKRIVDIGPCGRLAEGEEPLDGARREVLEETSINPKINESFCAEYTYEFNDIATGGKFKGEMSHIIKTRRYYAAEIQDSEIDTIKLSQEHSEMILISIEGAIAMAELKPQQKELLRKFDAWLHSKA